MGWQWTDVAAYAVTLAFIAVLLWIRARYRIVVSVQDGDVKISAADVDDAQRALRMLEVWNPGGRRRQ
jgi:hypothetical protein